MRAAFLMLPALFLVTSPLQAGSKEKKSYGKKSGKGGADKLVKSGENAYLAGNFDEALSIFKKVIKKYPKDHRSYYYSAVIYAEKGKKDEAETMYRAALEKNPKLPEALNNLAVLLQEKKQFKEARQLFEKALKEASSYFEAQYNLGYLYEEWNKADQAVKAYWKAADINGSDTDALIAIAEIETARGKLKKAINAYRKAIKRNSALVSLKINIAALLRKQGKNKEAAKELESLLSVITISEGADLTIPFKAARGLRLAGKPGRTLDILSKFPAKARESFSVQTEMGQCYLALGKCKKAVNAFKKALKLKPEHPEVLLAIADSCYCAKKCKEAVQYYNKFLKKTEKSDKRKQDVKNKIKSCQ